MPTAVRPVPTKTPTQPLALPAPPWPRIEPLSAERYALTLTIGRELLEKLERARDLMMHANPRGDLAVVVERAVEALLAKLDKQRLAKTERPQSKTRPCAPDRVAANVKREVFARDGEQCTYVDEATGERCEARAFLELDHKRPRARGGPTIGWNLRVRCWAHNRLHAEQCFGRSHVEQRIDFRL
jgi:5-methylcytosine-specific restriction endonuclease McrA